MNALISDLGIKDYGIAAYEKARIVYTYTAEIVSKGWQFTLTRNYGNSIPVDLNTVQFTGLLDFRSEEYTERWRQDTITVYVDETGIQFFSWTDPIEVIETLNENVSLLPFEDVKERIKSNIKYGYSKSAEDGWANGECDISVDRVMLANVLVPIKDDLQHQTLSPTWLVYYTFYVDYKGKVIDEWKSVFAVNAIDGSSIDLRMRSHEFEQRLKEHREK